MENKLDETKLAEFNVELQALLLKYHVNLQINHGIQVIPKEEHPEQVSEGETK